MHESLPELVGQFLSGLAALLWALLSGLVPLLLPWLPLALWCLWWLCCVNWKHVWPVLARGGWVVLVLLTLLAALVWAALSPSPPNFQLSESLPSFWWQLGVVSGLVALALVCGWLQGLLHWSPREVDFDAAGHGAHEHGSPGHGGTGHHGHPTPAHHGGHGHH
jgi:hypothetical protein